MHFSTNSSVLLLKQRLLKSWKNTWLNLQKIMDFLIIYQNDFIWVLKKLTNWVKERASSDQEQEQRPPVSWLGSSLWPFLALGLPVLPLPPATKWRNILSDKIIFFVRLFCFFFLEGENRGTRKQGRIWKLKSLFWISDKEKGNKWLVMMVKIKDHFSFLMKMIAAESKAVKMFKWRVKTTHTQTMVN